MTLPSVPEEPKSGAIKILLDRLFPERKREQAELKRQIAARVETSLVIDVNVVGSGQRHCCGRADVPGGADR